jgi:hypothetical protein
MPAPREQVLQKMAVYLEFHLGGNPRDAIDWRNFSQWISRYGQDFRNLATILDATANVAAKEDILLNFLQRNSLPPVVQSAEGAAYVEQTLGGPGLVDRSPERYVRSNVNRLRSVGLVNEAGAALPPGQGAPFERRFLGTQSPEDFSFTPGYRIPETVRARLDRIVTARQARELREMQAAVDADARRQAANLARANARQARIRAAASIPVRQGPATYPYIMRGELPVFRGTYSRSSVIGGTVVPPLPTFEGIPQIEQPEVVIARARLANPGPTPARPTRLLPPLLARARAVNGLPLPQVNAIPFSGPGSPRPFLPLAEAWPPRFGIYDQYGLTTRWRLFEQETYRLFGTSLEAPRIPRFATGISVPLTRLPVAQFAPPPPTPLQQMFGQANRYSALISSLPPGPIPAGPLRPIPSGLQRPALGGLALQGGLMYADLAMAYLSIDNQLDRIASLPTQEGRDYAAAQLHLQLAGSTYYEPGSAEAIRIARSRLVIMNYEARRTPAFQARISQEQRQQQQFQELARLMRSGLTYRQAFEIMSQPRAFAVGVTSPSLFDPIGLAVASAASQANGPSEYIRTVARRERIAYVEALQQLAEQYPYQGVIETLNRLDLVRAIAFLRELDQLP